jgi:DNA-directed RNA polymerase specialized sigma24 family protein
MGRPSKLLAKGTANELAEVVRRALQQLPDYSRQVILLRYREEVVFERIGIV